MSPAMHPEAHYLTRASTIREPDGTGTRPRQPSPFLAPVTGERSVAQVETEVTVLLDEVQNGQHGPAFGVAQAASQLPEEEHGALHGQWHLAMLALTVILNLAAGTVDVRARA